MPNLNELDPDSPEYEAALEAAQAEEDRAIGNTEASSEDEQTEGEAPVAVTEEAAEPAAEAASEPAEPAAEPDAGPIAGVLSADGKRVLPYVALKAERRNASHERKLRETAERERDEALRRLEELKAGKEPEPDAETLTDEDLEDLKLIGPAGAKAVARLKEAEEKLSKLSTAKPEPEAEPIDPRQAAAEAVQEDIDQIPLLLEWQAADAEKFARAQELDNVLKNSRKWADKPQYERFLHVTALVADEFDVPFEQAPRTTPTPAKANPKEAISNAKRVPPSTLSDFKGGAVDQTDSRIESLPPMKAMAALSGRSDAEIDAWLAKVG